MTKADVLELRDKFLLDKSIPSTGKRKKTDREKAIDACIPEAVHVANRKFKAWWRKNETADKGVKQRKILWRNFGDVFKKSRYRKKRYRIAPKTQPQTKRQAAG